MATVAAGPGDVGGEQSLFVRKATGLVRGWSVRDAFIYAVFSINIVTLGFVAFSYAPFIPKGSLLWAVLVAGAYLVLQGVTYASLIAAMPRAGGDYVWMSRVLGGGIGFVLAIAGWWFILWLWVPIYGGILANMVIVPLAAIAGWHGGVTYFSDLHHGLFVASLITAVLASVLIGLGIRTYARIQKFCFYGGVFGLAVMILLLLVNSKAGFIHHFNHQSSDLFGVNGAYGKTVAAGTKGYSPPSVGSFNFSGVFLLIPFMAFFNLWSNWGATLYGEVRGASDFRKNIYAMAGALITTSIAAIIFFMLISKTMGWDFYNAANNAFWSGSDSMGGVWPYPVTLATFFVSPWLQFIVIVLMSLWFFGWVGTVFLTASRVIFATAFDRILPEKVAKVSRNGVPYYAILIMFVPSLVIAYFYAYNSTFTSWTLDATLVIAVTFVGSTVAAMILPWRKPEIYNASPIARYKIAGIPLITVAGVAFLAFLGFCIYYWLKDDVYGSNNRDSLLYMGCLYLVALGIYVVSRIVRARQGMNLKMVYNEIPAE